MAQQADPARIVKDAYAGWLATARPACTAVLESDSEYQPIGTAQQLLVADDGGPALKFRVLAEPIIRVTAFAHGRTLARQIGAESADWIVAHRPAGIARIKNVSALLVTKDRATGAWLASFTMPVIVRPIPA
ncbi:hypothetical protein A3N99_02825 [Mycobacteroides abscessus]|uniref:hypothetical protein n=1 Tax=Mycobacteroides abscessus TaxID=36809 RepID=UPI00078CA9BD|nr:hypothetical protein [Mycobacteroides abscessus]AMU39241.1 hypothetical protein A3N99_02825 [Mycobacteroides abscessus]